MMDIALAYPIRSDQSDFAIRPGLTRLGVQVNMVLRFLQPGQPERAFDIHADTGIVHLDPRWHQAFCCSRAKASSTSSTAPITCCFCCVS